MPRVLRHFTFCLLHFAVCICLFGAGVCNSYGADRPNIVFVLADDLGYADPGCMAAKDIRTPHIDRLASEGLKFTDFYANAPVCSPTRCGFITGRWQQRVGFEWALGYTAEQQRLIDGQWQPVSDIHNAIGLPSSQPGIACSKPPVTLRGPGKKKCPASPRPLWCASAVRGCLDTMGPEVSCDSDCGSRY